MTKKGKKHKEGSSRLEAGESMATPREEPVRGGGRKKHKDKGADPADGGGRIKPRKLKAVTSLHISLLPTGSPARASFDPSTGCLEFGIPLTLEIKEPKAELDLGATLSPATR